MAYAILLVSAILVELTVNLPMGSLPLALAGDGVTSTGIAMVNTIAALAPLLGSLPVGGLVDRFGRVLGVRVAGLAASLALLGLSYVHGLAATAAVMALRSLAITAYITAEFAYASAIVAPERAVSAVATLGMVGNLAFAISPAVGVWLWQHGVGREQYLFGSLPALLGVGILLALPKRHDVRIRRSRRIFMRSAWLPALTFLIGASLVSGVNTALAVITLHQRGMENAALLFTALAITTFTLRYPAGRLVDRFGPRVVAVPTAAFQFGGAILAANAHTPQTVAAAGCLLGFAWGAMVPIGVALLFERSSKTTRGAAMGAYNMALSLGAVGGAALATAASALGLGYGPAVVVAGAGPALALPWVFVVGPGKTRR
jgi:MFS family permease